MWTSEPSLAGELNASSLFRLDDEPEWGAVGPAAPRMASPFQAPKLSATEAIWQETSRRAKGPLQPSEPAKSPMAGDRLQGLAGQGQGPASPGFSPLALPAPVSPLFANDKQLQQPGGQGQQPGGQQPGGQQSGGQQPGGQQPGSKGDDSYQLMTLSEIGRHLKARNANLRFSEIEDAELTGGSTKIGGHAPNSYHYAKGPDGKRTLAFDMGLKGSSADGKMNFDTMPLGDYEKALVPFVNRFRATGLFHEAIGPEQDPKGHGGQNAHLHAALDGKVPINAAMLNYLATGQGSMPYRFERT